MNKKLNIIFDFDGVVINSHLTNKSPIVKVKKLSKVIPSTTDYYWIVGFFSSFILIQFI